MERLKGKLVHDGRIDELNDMKEEISTISKELKSRIEIFTNIMNDLNSYDVKKYVDMSDFFRNRQKVLQKYAELISDSMVILEIKYSDMKKFEKSIGI